MPALIKKNVDEALVQASYMSGDRNAIASALKLNARLGVIILAPATSLTVANELRDFYVGVAGANRITIHPVPQGVEPDAISAVKSHYRWINEYLHRDRSDFPIWIRPSLGQDVKMKSATFGTQVIANEFERDASSAQKMIQALWRLDKVKQNPQGWGPPKYSDLRTKVMRWLGGKGFNPGRQYVILFAKRGLRSAEKAHHFTSILTWRILQERIERETSVIPVASGDQMGLRTIPDMVEFWNDPGWKEIFQGHQIDARAAQLGMWCFLAENLRGISIVGMRSGMIEVPALLGIRTLYLEELHNQQAERMLKWVGKVPTYERQQVNRPPGIAQQVYWAEQSRKAPYASPVATHARNTGGHVRGLVQGFEKTNIGGKQADPPDVGVKASDPAYPQRLAAAVFGRGGLAPALSAQQFMLESDEFDAILTWIKNGNMAPDVAHGNVSGHLVKKDLLHQDLAAKRDEQSWSEYFASKEYQSHFAKLAFPTALGDAAK